jgi:hypothetical protein
VQVAENTTATMRDVPADTSSYFNNPGITPSSQAGLGEAPIVRSNLGKLRVMEGYESTAQAKVQAEEAKSTRETLQEGYDKAQKFREAAPAVVQMMDLVHKSDLGGPLAAPLTVVRQIASQLGFSNDEMGRITNTQSFLKMALPHVIEKVREVSSRPSQLEFTNIQKLLAGNQDIDQGTAINVLRQILTEGMGNVETLQKNIDRASQLGFYGRGLAESREPGFSPKEILDQAYAIPGLHPDVVKGRAGFERLPTGTWLDTNLGQPQSYGANVREPGKAQPPATNTKGWVLMRDKNGNTAYVSPDGKQHEAVQ